MKRLLEWSTKLYKNPIPLLVIVAALTIFFAFGIPRLKVDNDIKAMMPADNIARVVTDYYDSEDNFGSSNAMLVGIESSDVYDFETLSYIKEMDDKISELNHSIPPAMFSKYLHLTDKEGKTLVQALRTTGINYLNYDQTLVKLICSSDALQKTFSWDKAFADKVAHAAAKIPAKKLFTYYDDPLGKIQSLVNADYIANEDDALVTEKLIPNEEVTPESIQNLKRRVGSWDTYRGMIVSKDGKLTAIVVALKTDDVDVKSAVNADMIKITGGAPSGLHVFLAGEPVLVDYLETDMFHDIPVLIPTIVIVIVLLLFLCFRRFRGIFYPLLVTVIAIIWTMGLMGYLNVTMTIITVAIPVLLMAIISAYGIHQMNHYYTDLDINKYNVLYKNAGSVGLAVLLSGITVMVGFGTLVTQEFVPIKNFGIFTAIGDLFGVLGALLTLPALLMLGGPNEHKKQTQLETGERRGAIGELLRQLVKINRNHSKTVIFATIGVGIVLSIGIFSVRSELDYSKFFKYNSPIRVADRIMNEKMAGTKNLTIVLDSDIRSPVTRKGQPDEVVSLVTPEVLKKIDDFASDVQKQFPEVQKVSSFADVMKKMNQEMNGGDPAYYRIPDNQDLISQYLILFSGDTKTFLTTNDDKFRIMLTMNSGSSDEIHKIAVYAKNYFSPGFQKANHFQVQVGGNDEIAYEANQALFRGSIESIFLCAIIVFMLLLLVLRSFWMSLISIVPIIICLLADFGFMGFTGITLNTATAMVSSVGIGIGIDFCIHFTTWYRRELALDGNITAALERSIIHKGRAILYNLFVIMGGFLVLLSSSLVPLNQFGLLTAICMVLTAGGSLMVVPAVIRLLSKKQYKFLYLGVEPINTRP